MCIHKYLYVCTYVYIYNIYVYSVYTDTDSLMQERNNIHKSEFTKKNSQMSIHFLKHSFESY